MRANDNLYISISLKRLSPLQRAETYILGSLGNVRKRKREEFKMSQNQLASLRAVLFVSIALVVTGCATTNALDDGKEVTADGKSMAVLVLTITNKHKLKYTPKPKGIYIYSKKTKDHESNLLILGVPKKPRRHEANSDSTYDEYLVGMRLDPGAYTMRTIGVDSNKFPVMGSGIVPMGMDFQIKSNTVTYLGRVDVLRRKKEKGEYMAGIPFPLIDQAVSGYSNGTFDVKIVDNYEQDVEMFKEKYAVLKSYTVEKNVLPAWQRPRSSVHSKK